MTASDMTREEAEAVQSLGEELLQHLGQVPAAYALACDLPAVHGLPLEEIDQLWHDRWTHEYRDWLVVLNGTRDDEYLESIGAAVPGGAALVVCDETLLALLTPLECRWLADPDTGIDLEGGDAQFWDGQLLGALHHRLVTNGKDLPPLDELMADVRAAAGGDGGGG